MSKEYELFAKQAIWYYDGDEQACCRDSCLPKGGGHMGVAEFARHPIRTTRNGLHETRRVASSISSGSVEGGMLIAALTVGAPLALEIGYAALALESLTRLRRSTHPLKDAAVLGVEFGLPALLLLTGLSGLAVPVTMAIIGYEALRRDGRLRRGK